MWRAKDGAEEFRSGGVIDDVFDELGDTGIALDGDDAAGTGGDFLDIGKGSFLWGGFEF